MGQVEESQLTDALLDEHHPADLRPLGDGRHQDRGHRRDDGDDNGARGGEPDLDA